MMPPTPMIGKLPPERVWMRRTTSTARWASGAPLRRPLPILSSAMWLVCSPSRRWVPLVATMPSSGVSSRMSLISSMTSSDMSGDHFEHDRPVLVLPAAEVEQRIEYLEYVRARMGGTFAAGVVAADVHREIVRILVEVAEEPEVIRGRIFGGVTVFLPMLQPTMNPSCGRRRWQIVLSSPRLESPMRLMMARSLGSRNTRGRGLPACGRGVTVPISMNPNPSAASSR